MRIAILFISTFSLLNLFGQEIITTDNGDVNIIPILHSSMVLQWQGNNILIDPYGGSNLYEDYPPDLILITDIHGDHYNKETIQGLELSNTTVVTPLAVKQLMSDQTAAKVTVLNNGETISWKEIGITGVPMYNLPESEDSRHPKGRGNGYVLDIGGIRIYVSGDTEDVPEMRSLKQIDVAFVCMNMPYTMEVDQAASAVIEFQPKVVYPFHYRGGGGKYSDVERFKKLVDASGQDIDVRIRDWYNH